MNKKQLKKGRELTSLIEKTRNAISGIKNLYKKGSRKDNLFDNHPYYWLNISEHGDGSGIKSDLCRSQGNMELLEIIIDTLENQLRNYEFEFEKL